MNVDKEKRGERENTKWHLNTMIPLPVRSRDFFFWYKMHLSFFTPESEWKEAGIKKIWSQKSVVAVKIARLLEEASGSFIITFTLCILNGASHSGLGSRVREGSLIYDQEWVYISAATMMYRRSLLQKNFRSAVVNCRWLNEIFFSASEMNLKKRRKDGGIRILMTKSFFRPSSFL